MKFWTVLLAGVLTFGAAFDSEARRLGGGGSFGRQAPNVFQRQATPPPAQPAAPAVAPRQAQQPAAAAAAQAQRRPWGGILGGLAAGLGLAWLASALGFGPEFAQFLLIALLALVLLAVVAAVMRRRAAAPTGTERRHGYAWQGAGATADSPASPRQYNPEKVGNDASARPWERGATALGGVRIGAGLESQQRGALEGSQNWGVPAGFDTEGFLAAAKRNFVTLQDAWDRGDVAALRTMMSDEMVHELRNQLAERDRQPAAPNKTEVVMLEAQLLGIEELATEYMASVEFSGMIREDPSAGPAPFREVWNMVKPKDGKQGWLVAGVQAMQ